MNLIKFGKLVSKPYYFQIPNARNNGRPSPIIQAPIENCLITGLSATEVTQGAQKNKVLDLFVATAKKKSPLRERENSEEYKGKFYELGFITPDKGIKASAAYSIPYPALIHVGNVEFHKKPGDDNRIAGKYTEIVPVLGDRALQYQDFTFMFNPSQRINNDNPRITSKKTDISETAFVRSHIEDSLEAFRNIPNPRISSLTRPVGIDPTIPKFTTRKALAETK